MERAIAEMEKIRKAEEIYSRRKNLEDNEKKSNSKNIYKILFEFLFLINVVIIIIAVQNQNYIFTKEFIEKINSYNINIREKIDELFVSSTNNPVGNEIKNEENILNENGSISGEANDVKSALVENNIEEENISQEEKDINEIKNNYSFILPISGIKTSGFGERESENSKVTKYHTGVDIAANIGTVIKSAISGKVIQVSSYGDYGKHIRIQNGDVVVLYAHCSKIYVNEGKDINQGDEIAEVGSTGNSTGPHLHFEIKLCDRLVNPEKILDL